MSMFSLDNYNKKVNKKWKFWSKFLTRTLPIYAGIIAAIPDDCLPAEAKVWITTIIAAIVATISGLSEFTLDKTPEIKEPEEVVLTEEKITTQ